VLDDPENFKTKEVSKLGVLDTILQPKVYPELYGNIDHVVRINYYPPRGDNKEGWDNIDIFGWMNYPMQIKVNFLCRDSILAAPIVLDLALFMDLAMRAGQSGVQEWLSFYFKSPLARLDGRSPRHPRRRLLSFFEGRPECGHPCWAWLRVGTQLALRGAHTPEGQCICASAV
jgi:myo-inositol-1-phosphate synthase